MSIFLDEFFMSAHFFDLSFFKTKTPSVGFGTPQSGQTEASVETFLLHSLQGFKAIKKLNKFISTFFYFI